MITDKSAEEIFIEIYENGAKNGYDMNDFISDFSDLYNHLSKIYNEENVDQLYSIIKAKTYLT